MSDNTLNRFLASGDTAARSAFVPSPPTPASGPDCAYFWWDTDLQAAYSWNGAAWAPLGSGLPGGGAFGEVLTVGSGGVAIWEAPAGGSVTHGSGALTNGQVVIGKGGGDIFILPAGTSGYVLTMGSGSIPNWEAPSGGSGTSIPVSSKSADYTLVLADAGTLIYHPTTDASARTWTIPANASVAFDIGTPITFDNDAGAGSITIAITSDTLVMVGTGSTGSRTLAAGGRACAIKVTATRWRIEGTGLS